MSGDRDEIQSTFGTGTSSCFPSSASVLFGEELFCTRGNLPEFECFVSRDYINSTLKLKAPAEECPSTLHRYPIVTPSTFRYRVDQFFDQFMDTRPTIDRLIVLIQYQPSIDRNVDRVMTEMSIEDIDREYRSTLDRG